MRTRPLTLFAAFTSVLISVCTGPLQASDPVETFISRADSISTAAGDEALSAHVADRAVLVGAAAGQLADVAIELKESGQPEAADENLAFAERISLLYRDRTGSSSPLELVRTYMAWDEGDLAARREAAALEEAAVEARNAGDFDRAIAALNDALAQYESIGDRRSVAILWGSLGVVYWYRGDFEAVAANYERALAARRDVEDSILEGRTLNGLGSVNYQLGNLEAARGYYQQAIDLRRETGDMGGLATSLNYLGNVHLAAGRVVDARRTLEEAAALNERAGNPGQQYELLISIASLNAEMGRISSSNAALEDALELALEMDDPVRQVICHNNLALNMAETYRYGESLGRLALVKSLLQEHPDPEQSLVYFRNSGITNLRIGELDWARADFDSLLALAGEYQMPAFQLEALVNLGYLFKEQARYEEGLLYAERARGLAEDIGSPRMVRETQILAAELDRLLGRHDSALLRWETLLAADEAEGVEANIAMDRMGMANIHDLAGRSEEARRILRGVRDEVERTGEGDLLLALAFGMGHSFEASDPESARFYYERALDILDETRREVGGTEVRTGYLGGVRRYYFEEVATYYAGLAKGDGARLWSVRAFETVERAKARGLLDLIETSVLSMGSAEEDALIDSLYNLDPDVAGYADRERDLQNRYAGIRSERIKSAGGARIAAGPLASPNDIARVIPRDAALLAYAVGDTASLLWVIDRRGCQVYRLPARAALGQAVAELRDAMASPVVGDERLRSSARWLYIDIVGPAEERIAKAGRLIIVPDDALFDLPFEVLLTREPAAGARWSEMPYMAKTYSMTYSPSASVYLALREARGGRSFDKELLALGDPDYGMLEPPAGLDRDITRLPRSRDEVLNISRSLPEEKKHVLLGREASEAALKQTLRGESVRVVHLATHGILDPADPAASCIVLCPDGEHIEDGYLQTLEVMSLHMDVGLVVLSACESARGRIGRGEGVVGLSRAFLASGARGLVASLWPVSDESTARLMEEFYRQMLHEKHPAGGALNEARLAMMNDDRFAHPFHWSSFVVIGTEGSPWR